MNERPDRDQDQEVDRTELAPAPHATIDGRTDGSYIAQTDGQTELLRSADRK